MHSIFVSDLHLTPERPRANELFFDFTSGAATQAASLYILGDLFEYWVGDDDLDDPFNASIAGALNALSGKGVALYFMHGNRDLLIGRTFAARCGAKLIADPTLLDLHGTPTLLMHGDTLCTDDVEYQKFRAYAHDPGKPAQVSRPSARGAETENARHARAERKEQAGQDRRDHGRHARYGG